MVCIALYVAMGAVSSADLFSWLREICGPSSAEVHGLRKRSDARVRLWLYIVGGGHGDVYSHDGGRRNRRMATECCGCNCLHRAKL